MVTLRGRVTTGIADLARWMTLHTDAYERIAGTPLVPGSLNIIIERPWVMTGAVLRLEASEVGVGVSLLPCQVDGIGCWILRTDRNNAGEGDHALNILELVSAAHLRSSLGLQDGDEVTVEMDE